MNLYVYSLNSSHSNIKVVNYIKKRLLEIYKDLKCIPFDDLNAIDFNSVSILIFSGGDGIFNKIVNQTHNYNITYGYIPTGTANDMGHNLGIKSVDKAIDAIKSGNTYKLQLLELESNNNINYFLYAFSIGSMSKIANNANRKKKKNLGKFIYILRGCLYLFSKRTKIEYTISNQKYEKKLRCLIVSRSKYLGGARIKKNYTNDLLVYRIHNIFNMGMMFILNKIKTINVNEINIKGNIDTSVDGEKILANDVTIRKSNKYINVFKK